MMSRLGLNKPGGQLAAGLPKRKRNVADLEAEGAWEDPIDDSAASNGMGAGTFANFGRLGNQENVPKWYGWKAMLLGYPASVSS